jgi:hypothetical protein
MDGASWKGHIKVLDWWLHSGLKLKYTKNAMNLASEYGHIEVLVRRMVAPFWIGDAIHRRCHGLGKLSWTHRSTQLVAHIRHS